MSFNSKSRERQPLSKLFLLIGGIHKGKRWEEACDLLRECQEG
jgi:hypothetical protein